MQTGSLVIRKLGGDRAGGMAIHRFLSAPSVTTGEMMPTLACRPAAACAGRQIVAVQDTAEINFAGREERDARNGGPRPATDVIDAALLPAADAIAPTLEGKTARQQNPHPRHSLAWLAWIIARRSGWNCYYKPPGPKTMRAGSAQFAAMAAGFLIATTQMIV